MIDKEFIKEKEEEFCLIMKIINENSKKTKIELLCFYLFTETTNKFVIE